MTRVALLGLAVCCLAVGCRKAPEGPGATAPTASAGREAAPASSPVTGPPDAGPELNPAFKKPDTPIFVGGCRERCREPISAFQGFLAAVKADPEGGEIIPFLNTAELVVNGEAHGAAWAELWVAKRWLEREASVRAFTRGFLAWVRNLPDPPEFDATMRDGVQVVKDESEEALLLWRHPRLADAAELSARQWRFVLRPRGLEWLIVAIDQHSGAAPARKTRREVK